MYQQGDICSTVSSFEAALLPCDPFFTLKAMRIVLKSSFDQFNHLTRETLALHFGYQTIETMGSKELKFLQ